MYVSPDCMNYARNACRWCHTSRTLVSYPASIALSPRENRPRVFQRRVQCRKYGFWNEWNYGENLYRAISRDIPSVRDTGIKMSRKLDKRATKDRDYVLSVEKRGVRHRRILILIKKQFPSTHNWIFKFLDTGRDNTSDPVRLVFAYKTTLPRSRCISARSNDRSSRGVVSNFFFSIRNHPPDLSLFIIYVLGARVAFRRARAAARSASHK